MVHSIELLFDDDTEAALRQIWVDLADAELGSRRPAGRPHVTLTVADGIAADVDALLRPVADQLPLACSVGPCLLLGPSHAILARLVVPSGELLGLHEQVHRISEPYLQPGPGAYSRPGGWTPHVTLARQVRGPATSQALSIAGRAPQIDGSFAGLRRWNGTTRTEYPIG